MVSEKFVDFGSFVKFHRSRPAIIFELSWSMLIVHQESSPSAQDIEGPHHDDVYYSRTDYGWFLMGLSIFDFSSNLTGPDMQKLSVLRTSRNRRAINQESFKLAQL